ACLVMEALGGLLVGGDVGIEQLDGDLGLERQVLGAVDTPHRAGADELDDAVLAGEGDADIGVAGDGRRVADVTAADGAELMGVPAVCRAARAALHGSIPRRPGLVSTLPVSIASLRDSAQWCGNTTRTLENGREGNAIHLHHMYGVGRLNGQEVARQALS